MTTNEFFREFEFRLKFKIILKSFQTMNAIIFVIKTAIIRFLTECLKSGTKIWIKTIGKIISIILWIFTFE